MEKKLPGSFHFASKLTKFWLKKKKKKILKNFGQKKLSKIKKKIVKITVITRKSQINSEEIQQYLYILRYR